MRGGRCQRIVAREFLDHEGGERRARIPEGWKSWVAFRQRVELRFRRLLPARGGPLRPHPDGPGRLRRFSLCRLAVSWQRDSAGEYTGERIERIRASESVQSVVNPLTDLIGLADRE